MSKKILLLCRDTHVVWIFDEDAAGEYGEATLIYRVTHIEHLSKEIYELKDGNETRCLQFGVKEIEERWY